MSRPGPSPPPALTPIASTSTAHPTFSSNYTRVRHRYEKEPMSSSPQERYPPSTMRPRRRKRREGEKSRRRLRWRKGIVTEAFRKFGEHCARNQIRTLLIDCLVMTNLFYPSMALYLQKKFPPLHPPSPDAHNTHRIPLQNEAGPSTYRQNPKEHPLSLLSTPVLDSFFPYPPPLLPRLTWSGWWEKDTSEEYQGWGLRRLLPQNAEDQVLNDEEIRIMRVGWADVEDVLDRDVEAGERSWEERDHILLRLVRDMAEEWETQYQSTGERCIRQMAHTDYHDANPAGACYILSPKQNPPTPEVSQIPMSDLVRQHPPLPHNSTTDDIPFGWAANAGNIYHSFALLFRVPSNSTTSFQRRWQKSITEMAKKVEGEVFVEAQGSRVTGADQTGQWFLSYTSHPAQDSDQNTSQELHVAHQPETISASPPKIVLFFYVILFTTLMVQLSNASKVHSRFGLAFTGVVQLCCSSVMSFSILALLGWNGWGSSGRSSSLPTYVLPFVIVVVGAENMSTLTKAIFSIPFTHSVPVRIGLGLSKVGTTIALTSLTDLLVLGIVWLCVNLRPVREFCLFAAVVIITDWFMLHTFFLTVLSIDAQRLELADVLASNGGPPISPVHQEADGDETGDGRQSGFNWRKLLRARTTKSGSLILLLITVGLLYWLTERHRIPLNTTAGLYGYTPTTGAKTMSSQGILPTPFSTKLSDLANLSSAERLWRSLNPLGWAYIRIFIPPASILVLPKLGHSMRPVDIRKLSLPTSRLLLPRLRPLFYLFKVVVLPQAVTAGTLYIVVSYLLKDADLLDAQRDRLGRVDEKQGNKTDISPNQTPKNSLVNRLKVHMLPCSHESDIDLISASSDGSMAISVGVDNIICLWRFDDLSSGSGTRENISIPIANLDPEDPIVASALSEDNEYISVCTKNGTVHIWQIQEEGPVVSLSSRQVNGKTQAKARITKIIFDDTNKSGAEDPFTIASSKATAKNVSTVPFVLVAFTDGSVFSVGPDSNASLIIESQNPDRVCRIAFIRSEGMLDILVTSSELSRVYRQASSGWLATSISENPEDRTTSVSMPNSSLPGLWAVGYRSGSIDLIDELIGHLVSISPNSSSEGINKVQLCRPSTMRCTGCNAVTSDGYLVISSTTSHVYLDRISPRTTTVFCRCSRPRTSLDEITTPFKSTSSSNPANLVVPPSMIKRRYSPGTSPKKSPSLLPPSNGDFPLSSHGGARRLSNLHTANASNNNNSTRGGIDENISNSTNSISPSTTNSPSGEYEIYSLGAISTFEEGDWEVLIDDSNTIAEPILVGLRKENQGIIDDSQWSIFTINLSNPWNGNTLNVGSMNLNDLSNKSLKETRLSELNSGNYDDYSLSINDRRMERLNSLNGRAKFPEVNFPERNGSASFSVPTFDVLGYVQFNQLQSIRSNGIIAGFGNRLGIIQINPNDQQVKGDRSAKKGNRITPTMNSTNGVIGMGLGMGTPTPRRSNSFPLAPPPSNSSMRTAAGNVNVNANANKKLD
ncbi:uncharacterized protein IL334_002621 [Kwoniella shivajii]|uniref:Sterol regulatory element-binding protein cleavage-activating protein n=1 Tax=Kwoniella shivajii TaxID=564305 RepID=A0ABZ1CYA6_9TREE|nr:hypothetical protein IL334_002621 [Kwoniella shivajii]